MRPGDVLLLSLTRDGRLANPEALDRLRERLLGTTDCFVFCHGWLVDQAEAREGADRFFARLDTALRPPGERVVPLRVAVHWPSKPFARVASARGAPDEIVPEFLAGLVDVSRARPGAVNRLALAICETEVPLGPEEELELATLHRLLRGESPRGNVILSPLHALSFWLMKRRAGQVGERLGREVLGPILARQGNPVARVHLVGHSFGAKLLTAAVMAGLMPHSLVLLLPAFSAFAFAGEVPGTKGPGHYRRVFAERMVGGPIVALRSIHDRALGALYPAVTWGDQVDRARPHPGSSQARDLVTRSAMGAIGARDVEAPDWDLVKAQAAGLPLCPVINVDGSHVVTANQFLIGAHCDIHHDEIATLVLMAAGLLQGGPVGARPRPLSPFHP